MLFSFILQIIFCVVFVVFLLTLIPLLSAERLHIQGQMVIRQHCCCKKTAMPHNISRAAAFRTPSSSFYSPHFWSDIWRHLRLSTLLIWSQLCWCKTPAPLFIISWSRLPSPFRINHCRALRIKIKQKSLLLIYLIYLGEQRQTKDNG